MPIQSAISPRKLPLVRLPWLALAAAGGLALAVMLLMPLRAARADPPAVTTPADSGVGSLRAALSVALDGETVVFNLPPNSVITLTSALTVTTAITIDGAGAPNLTISGDGVTRVFSVTAPLHLLSLTVAGGVATGPGGGLYTTSPVTLTGVTFRANATVDARGGGLYTQATLNATNSNFLTNTVTAITSTAGINRGGGAYAEGGVVMVGGLFFNNRILGAGSGGGLGTSSDASLTGTQLISNTTGDSAGGLRVVGAATLTSLIVRDNVAGSVGGGLLVNGTAIVSDSVFAGNHAGATGGGARFSGPATLLGGTFVTNSTNSIGGGLYAGVGLVFSGTAFLTNTAVGDGGGLYVVGGVAVGAGGLLRGNTAGEDGGGLVAFSGAHLTGTQFFNNSAVGNGGGLELDGGDGRLVNLLAANNTAGDTGAGLHLTTAGEVVVLHVTVAAAAANPGSAIAVEDGTVTLTNTILAGHATGLALLGGAAAEDYTLFYNTTVTATAGVSLGANSLLGNPQFVNAAAGDFHLGLFSAATNAGADAGVLTDLDGAPRPFDGAFDLGAYERQVVERLLYLPLILR